MTPAFHAPRNCKYCGEKFTPKKGGAKMKYCSDLCAANSRQKQSKEWHGERRKEEIARTGIEDKRSFGDYSIRARDYIKAYPEGFVENLITVMKAYADLHGYYVNPDEHRTDMIIRGLLGRNLRHGLYYCPSRALTGDPTVDATIVCPCVFLEDDVQYRGSCNCRLFVDTSDFEEPYVSKGRPKKEKK